MTDIEILEAFKNLQEIIKAQKELNHIFDRRLKILEAAASASKENGS